MGGNRFSLLIIVLIVPFYFLGSILGHTANQAPDTVTFSKDVAPILYRHCVECHRPGDIAPMPLVTYQNAQPYAQLIKEKVNTGEMPPWHADPHYGQFANERKLSDEEIKTLTDWFKQGAPEGNKRDLPLMPAFSERWKIGTPDTVYKMAREHTLGTDAADTYVYFRIPTNFKEDKWVQAVEFRPGNRQVVHHAVAFIETPEQFAATRNSNSSEKTVDSTWSLLDSKPSALELMEGTTRRIKPDAKVVNDGCSASDVEAVSTGSSNTVLSVYAPGRGVDAWPAGTAKKIPANSNLILQMHYSKAAGEKASDLTSVALVFAKAPVEKMVASRSINNVLFEIPARAGNHKVTACWDVGRDIQLLSFMPHMHVRGKSMRYEVAYADGRRETVLFVPHYSFHWQTLYALKNPITIPGNSRLIVTAYFDNSEQNMHNPDPSKAIRHGSATFDEMMIGFVDYVVPKPRERMLTQVDPALYEAYVGRYEFDSAPVVQHIVKIGNSLYAESGGQRVELHPTSESTFTLDKGEAEIIFTKNGEGIVTGFVITRNEKLFKV
ncbi:MAG: hypothetical protein WKF84_08890 [Pyrinomonadaceae bacterium]